MTGKELLTYKMNKEEQVMWYRFCVDIKNKLLTLKIDEYAYHVMMDKMTKGTPYTYAGGYSKEDGYYYVVAGDRGDWNLIYKTKFYDEAWEQMLKELAHDIAYEVIVKNEDAIEKANRHRWRYYQEYVGREKNRIIYRDVENFIWEYDAKYDYRKYWFEMALNILSKTVSKVAFCAEIENYEKLLNRWFEKPYWKYDVEKASFCPILEVIMS